MSHTWLLMAFSHVAALNRRAGDYVSIQVQGRTRGVRVWCIFALMKTIICDLPTHIAHIFN